MNEQAGQPGEKVSVEFAAGGLVWDKPGSIATLGIVHRRAYGDWTLPKGRSEPNESWEETARREVKEELGCETTILGFAGSTSYAKAGRPKVVLFWEMRRASQEPFVPTAEVDEIAWLPPRAAAEKLTHPAERDFVNRQDLSPPSRVRWPDLQRQRLDTAIEMFETKWNCRRGLRDSVAKDSWVCIVNGLLEKAKIAVRAHDLDKGWTLLHEAERFSIFDLKSSELLSRITSTTIEAEEKLSSWRKRTVLALFPEEAVLALKKLPLDGGPDLLRPHHEALLEAVWALHGHHNNVYYRTRLAASQLRVLVVWLCCLLPAIGLYFTGFHFSECSYKDAPLPWIILGAALFGALGAVLTAAFQLSRAGHKKIPESILTGIITSGRPLIGAASAIFLVVVINCGLIALIDRVSLNLATYLAVAFVAGFSEQFVVKTAGSGGQSRVDTAALL
jgi:8-oxo-dGTP pyrophosphatase MutT (NUDIX family)